MEQPAAQISFLAALQQLGDMQLPIVPVYDWSKTADFELCWNGVHDDPRAVPANVVVVWLSTATDDSVQPVSAGHLLSPIEWAACLARRQEVTIDQASELPAWRTMVTVLDMAPSHNKHSREKFEKFPPECLSWVTVLKWTRTLTLRDIFPRRWVAQVNSQISPRTYLDTVHAEFVRAPSFHGFTAGRPDRHAIANLLGPMLVLPEHPATDSPHRLALLALLRVAAEQPPKPASPRENTALVLPTGKTHFVLCDDMWPLGWADWLNSHLGGDLRGADRTIPARQLFADEAHAALHVASSPDFLVKAATDHLAARAGSNASSLDNMRLVDSGQRQVLLLDLRLFLGDDTAERSLLRALLALRAEAAKALQPHWTEVFTQSELDALRAWVNGTGIADEALRVSLLPATLAAISPHLPIVLFSSTSRRRVVEILSKYPNIISDFEKPRHFESFDSDAADRANLRLQSALEAAAWRAELHATMSALATPNDPGLIRKPAWPENAPGAHRHVSLYVDESGSVGNWPMVLGGILASFRDPDHEREFNDAIAALPESIKKQLVSKSTASITQQVVWSNVCQVAQNLGVVLAGVSLTAQHGILQHGQRDSPVVPLRQLDSLHRHMMAALAEIVLYYLRPSVPGLSSVESYSYYCDLRNIPEKMLDVRWLECFGFDGRVPGGLVPTLPTNGVLPLLEQVIARHANSGLSSLEIKVARACYSPSTTEFAWPDVAMLHLADSYTRCIRQASLDRAAPAPWAHLLAGRAFNEDYDLHLLEWLDLARGAESGAFDVVSAKAVAGATRPSSWAKQAMALDVLASLESAAPAELELHLQRHAQVAQSNARRVRTATGQRPPADATNISSRTTRP